MSQGSKNNDKQITITDVQPVNWFDKGISILEQNIRGVQLGIYSVAFCGLAFAVRSVRPFKKFTNPKQIPSEFFKKHVKLNGIVLRIDFHPKPVLLVNHTPLVFGKFRNKDSGIKVGIEGVDLSPNGVSWLQTLLVGKPIQFVLLSYHPDFVSCIVKQNDKSIGIQLVSLGFASVSTYNHILSTDKVYNNYYQLLLKQESKAESKGLGMWNEKSASLFLDMFLLLPLKWIKFNAGKIRNLVSK